MLVICYSEGVCFAVFDTVHQASSSIWGSTARSGKATWLLSPASIWASPNPTRAAVAVSVAWRMMLLLLRARERGMMLLLSRERDIMLLYQECGAGHDAYRERGSGTW